MSRARAKRRWMAWQRYHSRIETSPTWFVYHRGYVNAHARVMYQGRHAPEGIRTPWILRTTQEGA